MSWRQSLWFLAASGLLLMSVAVVFAIQGYWLILPFAGLELAVLAWCNYLVAHAGERCEVVSLDGSQVVVEKGRRKRLGSGRSGPDSKVSFPQAWARVELHRRESWYPDRLTIGSSGTHVELGDFLEASEKKALASELQKLLNIQWPKT